MSKIVLHMSMSVDGFITGPDDGIGRGLGVGGERLHDWLSHGGVDPGSHRPVDETNATVFDEAMATGAVITGRRTFDHAGVGRRPPRWSPDLRADPCRTRPARARTRALRHRRHRVLRRPSQGRSWRP
jgi:dihydrofolate reductase